MKLDGWTVSKLARKYVTLTTETNSCARLQAARGPRHAIQWPEKDSLRWSVRGFEKKNRWEPINFRQSRLRRDEIHQWYIIWNLDADVTVLIQISIIPIYEFCRALDARITSRCHRGDYCIKNALSRIICSISAGNGPSITTWQKMFDVQVTSCLGTKTN